MSQEAHFESFHEPLELLLTSIVLIKAITVFYDYISFLSFPFPFFKGDVVIGLGKNIETDDTCL